MPSTGFEAAPGAVVGQICFDTSTSETKVFDGSDWHTVTRPLSDADFVFYKVAEIELEKEQGCYESTR